MSKISTLRTIITLIVFLVVSVVPALGHQAGAVAQGTGSAARPQAGQPPEPSGIERLMADTGGGARVSLNPATGVAGFVRLPQGLKMSTSFFSPTSATGEADVFFTQYGGVFGVTQPAAELDYMGRQVDGMGNTHVAYQQLYQGVPVFAGVLKVHLNEQNAITAVNGTFVPKISVSSSPGLTADEAAQIATSTVAGQNDLRGPNDLSAVNSKLFVFRTGLVEGVVGADHLVYEVEVANTAVTVREFVYVDAHTGEVVDQYTGIHVVKDRQTYDANFDSAAGPASVLCRGEGDPPSGDLACDEAHDYAGDTYDYFFNAFGRDSLDDAGMSLISYVNVCPGGVCP